MREENVSGRRVWYPMNTACAVKALRVKEKNGAQLPSRIAILLPPKRLVNRLTIRAVVFYYN